MATVLPRTHRAPSLMDQVRALEAAEAKQARKAKKVEAAPDVETAKPARAKAGTTKRKSKP